MGSDLYRGSVEPICSIAALSTIGGCWVVGKSQAAAGSVLKKAASYITVSYCIFLNGLSLFNSPSVTCIIEPLNSPSNLVSL